MADDKLSEGSEEERNSMSESSDDDFGLPDLEFDELQELDLSIDDDDDSDVEMSEPVDQPLAGSDDVDMSVLDDLTASDDLNIADVPGLEDSVIDEGIEEVEDVLDSAQLISDRLGDDSFGEDLLTPIPEGDKEISIDDLMGGEDLSLGSDDLSSTDSVEGLLDEPVASGDDILSNIDSPDDLAALGFADEEASDVGAEPALDDASDLEFGGSSLFSADDNEEEDSIFSTESTSSFDTPETQTASLSEDEGKLPENYKSYTYKESSGGFTKVIIIGVVVIAVIAAGLLWLNSGDDEGKVADAKPKTEKKKPSKKKPVKKPAKVDNKEKATPKSKPKVEEKKKPEPKPEPIEKVEEVTVAQAAPGEIILVSERLGVSYIIVGSFVDEDLAMDFAGELSNLGTGIKVISPYGKSKRYRVSVADFATYGDAASQLNSFKADYGDQIWALKY